MILSKTFDTLNKTLKGLRLFWLNSASFNSSGKHPFSDDKLMNFVISEKCISSVTLSMSAGMFPTALALEPSILKTTCRTCSSVICWKENFLLLLYVYLILSIHTWRTNFLRMSSKVTRWLSWSLVKFKIFVILMKNVLFSSEKSSPFSINNILFEFNALLLKYFNS